MTAICNNNYWCNKLEIKHVTSRYLAVYIFTLMASQLIQGELSARPIQSSSETCPAEQAESQMLMSLLWVSAILLWLSKGVRVRETLPQYSGGFLPYIFSLTFFFQERAGTSTLSLQIFLLVLNIYMHMGIRTTKWENWMCKLLPT